MVQAARDSAQKLHRDEAVASTASKPQNRNGRKGDDVFPFTVPPFDLDSWSSVNADAIGSLTRSGAAWANSLIDLNREVLNFLNRRWSEDISIQRRLVKAKSFEDVQAIYSDFFATASSHYGEESQKLAELSTKMTKVTFDAMQENASGK
ncbi:MAG TPA: phasin family protein [Hyphomicrobiales bacterium]|nr:phasin family protein [Rhodobiaceae bacterium]HXK53434.1 phasin family protein [Hyphomicrobiales bacterium]